MRSTFIQKYIYAFLGVHHNTRTQMCYLSVLLVLVPAPLYVVEVSLTTESISKCTAGKF